MNALATGTFVRTMAATLEGLDVMVSEDFGPYAAVIVGFDRNGHRQNAHVVGRVLVKKTELVTPLENGYERQTAMQMVKDIQSKPASSRKAELASQPKL